MGTTETIILAGLKVYAQAALVIAKATMTATGTVTRPEPCPYDRQHEQPEPPVGP